MIRFVYPVIYQGKRSLQIQREDEDGYIYFGVRDAITNYCEQNGVDLSKVTWKVCADAIHFTGFTDIIAKDSDDWLAQFESFPVSWKVIKEN